MGSGAYDTVFVLLACFAFWGEAFDWYLERERYGDAVSQGTLRSQQSLGSTHPCSLLVSFRLTASAVTTTLATHSASHPLPTSHQEEACCDVQPEEAMGLRGETRQA